jgi:hypothetical protein
MHAHAYTPKYLLRWRFEWPDRPAKFGMWSHAGRQDDLATKAWCHNKEGLLWAVVEAKDYITREIKTIVRCPGQDFRNFQWITLAIAPAIGLKGSVRPMTMIGGITINTRNEDIDVFDSGTLKRRPSTNQNVNFATYGK